MIELQILGIGMLSQIIITLITFANQPKKGEDKPHKTFSFALGCFIGVLLGVVLLIHLTVNISVIGPQMKENLENVIQISILSCLALAILIPIIFKDKFNKSSKVKK